MASTLSSAVVLDVSASVNGAAYATTSSSAFFTPLGPRVPYCHDVKCRTMRLPVSSCVCCAFVTDAVVPAWLAASPVVRSYTCAMSCMTARTSLARMGSPTRVRETMRPARLLLLRNVIGQPHSCAASSAVPRRSPDSASNA